MMYLYLYIECHKVPYEKRTSSLRKRFPFARRCLNNIRFVGTVLDKEGLTKTKTNLSPLKFRNMFNEQGDLRKLNYCLYALLSMNLVSLSFFSLSCNSRIAFFLLCLIRSTNIFSPPSGLYLAPQSRNSTITGTSSIPLSVNR
jgi:hypothetical protein